MFEPSLLRPSYPLKILGIRVRPDYVPQSGVQMLWDKMYPSCGAEIDPLLTLSTPFLQVTSARASLSILLMHIQSLFKILLSTQNVTFLHAEIITIDTLLGYYQLV